MGVIEENAGFVPVSLLKILRRGFGGRRPRLQGDFGDKIICKNLLRW
jgi:hypothetical protein